MAFRLRVLTSALLSARQCQLRLVTPSAMTGIMNNAVAGQRRHLSSADSPPYEEFTVQSTEDFNQKVINSKMPTVVDFYATWCKPCKALTPRLHEVLSERPGRVQLAKVDVDQHTDLAMDYDVSSIPKVVMFKEGKVAGEFVGLMEKDKIESFIDRLTL
ncbi:thioredoxin, mitochondrial-like [Acanthaster planci]|uniref:Thioredoxin, mitochondrial-like n=1 Tax=Acanthaster planci TaxID=133434 RepID=A0A8B7YJU8_ACAPL|nr:thioredoxin, mitochondrial-like [Acanthaster planci]XP_022092696.1 thioredoxin, mitochondrial-like [Acanthaster planci]